jgi:ubiquinone/menaquinone biosynthesis C-methylase UbiE
MDMWSGVAGRVSAWVMGVMNRDMEREAAFRLSLPADAHVLEIGFGAGDGIGLLAERFPKGRVFGVDPSSTMLAVATRNNRERVANGQVTLWVAPADRLPVADASLDGIVMVNCLQLLEPLEASLHECARTLRPGGSLVTLTHAWATPASRSPDAWVAEVRGVLESVGFTEIASERGRARSGATLFIGAQTRTRRQSPRA